jgi:simple sugar transport system ATP-binding protein
VRGLSFELAAGERVGVTGLRGSGAFLLGRVLAGASPFARGTVEIDGRQLPSGRPDQALRLGVGYVPEDRQLEGFVPMLGAAENMTLTVSERLSGRFGFLPPSRVHGAAAPVAAGLALVSAGLDQPVAELSGGNQQKVTVGRALMHQPRLIVAVAPTRGVDVASKARLLASLDRAVQDTGAALLLITDEIDDLEICDRVMVMVRGQLEREFDTPPWIRDELITASEGLRA